MLVMTTQRITKGTTAHRKTLEEQWDKSMLEELKGTAWKHRPGGDEEVESRMHIELAKVEAG